MLPLLQFRNAVATTAPLVSAITVLGRGSELGGEAILTTRAQALPISHISCLMTSKFTLKTKSGPDQAAASQQKLTPTVFRSILEYCSRPLVL